MVGTGDFEPDVVFDARRYFKPFLNTPNDKSGAAILAEPINRLRYDFVQSIRQKKEGEDPNAALDEWAAKLQATITDTATGTAFDAELKKAKQVLSGNDVEDPQPASPQSKLLWAIVLQLSGQAQMKARATQGMEPEKAAIETQASMGKLLGALANSGPMRGQMQRFYDRVSKVNRSQYTNDTVVQYGAPGSWFYFANPKHNPHLANPTINLDLFYSLVLGDYVDAVFQHELEHAEKSNHRPPRIEALQETVKSLKEQIGAVKITKGKPVKIPKAQRKKLEELMVAEYELNLRHGLWNAIEDNMCNQGVCELPYLQQNPYPYALDHSINLTSAIIAGTGNYITGQKEIEAESSEDPKEKLDTISHAMNMAFFLRNGLAIDTPEHWQEIGVDTRDIKHKDHPQWAPDRAYRHMQRRLDEIAIDHPQPDDRKLLNYPDQAKAACTQRNEKIEALFRDYLDDLIQQAIDEFKKQDLQKQMDMLQKAAEQAANGDKGGAPMPAGGGGGGGQGIPIEVEGEGAGTIPAEPGNNHGQGQGNQDGVGNGRSMKDLEDKKYSGEGDEPGQGQSKRDAGKKAGAGNKPTGQKSAGAAGNALGKLDLGDGRSLEELRSADDYQAAVDQIANKLADIARNFPSIEIGLQPEPTGLTAKHLVDRARRDDRALRNLGVAVANDTWTPAHMRLTKDDDRMHIETPGDLYLMIDTSGSMGHGKGSSLEIALKSACLLRDAGKKVGEILNDPKKAFNVYITCWGNRVPTVLALPDTPDEIIDHRLDAAIAGTIEGLHQGTELAPSIAAMLYHFSQGHAGIADTNPNNLRGPAHAVILSDGGLFGEKINYAGVLNALPPLTLDTILTHGEDSVLHKGLLEATQQVGQHHQIPKCFPLDDIKKTPSTLLEWAEERLNVFKSANATERKSWATTHQAFKDAADGAFRDFCREENGTGIKTTIFEKQMQEADKQAGVTGPTQSRAR